MNSDELSRNMHYSPNRKPLPPKNQVYSPSTNYNYNGNQGQHGNHGGHGNPNYSNQQHHRRKPNQFKRDGHGFNDRLFKQNDMIIRLLKEIRDRLPEPPAPPAGIDEPVQETMESTPPAPSLQEIPADTALEPEASVPADQDREVAVTAEVSDDELDQQVNGNI